MGNSIKKYGFYILFFVCSTIWAQNPALVKNNMVSREVFIEPPAQGTYDYYISENGDNTTGTSESTAWTYARLQTEITGNTFVAGDTVALEGGLDFLGGLVFNGNDGSIGNPIVFTSFGTGKATITSVKALSGSWTDTGGNVWSISTGGDVAYQAFKDDAVIHFSDPV